MPTGYTSDIGKGISFKEFVFTCARAFGACFEMRDEPISTPMPEKFKVSSYHKDKIQECEKELLRLSKITIEESEKLSKTDYDKKIKSAQSYIHETKELKVKYEEMLDKVKNWQPPTEDHNGLKIFMEQQIRDSIGFDCGVGYWENQLHDIKLVPGKVWLNDKKREAAKDLKYHTEEFKKENERVNGRNSWIKELRDSL